MFYIKQMIAVLKQFSFDQFSPLIVFFIYILKITEFLIQNLLFKVDSLSPAENLLFSSVVLARHASLAVHAVIPTVPAFSFQAQ